MKKVSFLLLTGAIAGFLGCSKSSTPTATPMVYIVSGVSDMTTRQYIDTSITMAIAVGYQSGPQEPVTISFSGLPAGVTMSPDSTGGTPSFASNFTMRSNVKTAGTYPVSVIARSATSGKKTLSFNLTVTPNSDCTSGIPGYYTSNTTCDTYTGTGTGTVTNVNIRATGTENQISLPTTFATLVGDLNCTAGTLSTARKINADFDIPIGTGTFATDRITINYTLTGAVNANCTTVYTR